MLSSIWILSIFTILPLVSSAQKVRTISGEYTYYAPSTVSPDQAKQTAIYRARLTALADAFGTYVYQNNVTSAHNDAMRSTLDFQSVGGSEVKGEWIGDTRDPEVDVVGYEANMLVVRARVRGKAREIVAAPIGYTAKILRNGSDPKFESDQFRAGDDLYLWFKTPVSGYLAVYLVDDQHTAYCLLPYMQDRSGRMPVGNNNEYLFFSAQCADPQTRSLVDEYTLTCKKPAEQNTLYIIFSPNEFAKADDVASGDMALPRELHFAQFQAWLSKSRIRDQKMSVEQKIITIRK